MDSWRMVDTLIVLTYIFIALTAYIIYNKSYTYSVRDIALTFVKSFVISAVLYSVATILFF